MTLTGWTWAHVSDNVTLPQVHTLQTYWRSQPPMVVLASRLCRYFGVEVAAKPKPVAKNAHDAMREAMAAGLPIAPGRPDDPDLAFLDE